VGDYPVYSTFHELITASDLIIKGEIDSEYPVVIRNNAEGFVADDFEKKAIKNTNVNVKDGEIVYTVSKFKIVKIYKGDPYKNGDTILVKQLGGSVGHTKYVEETTVPFKPSKTYILFLKTYEDGTPLSLLNPQQGYYEVSGNEILKNKNNKIDFMENEFN
jgi:hypothetical protein